MNFTLFNDNITQFLNATCTPGTPRFQSICGTLSNLKLVLTGINPIDHNNIIGRIVSINAQDFGH
ncbi:MAG: hypothetical protein JST26_04830 [Bacteroidetes bacterium]|nr:hypothetical protein [Bacteroidota bacterium]